MPLGIPSRQNYGDLSKLEVGKLIDWVVQKHQADRAGLHHDVRFGTPETGLYSWASRKGLPAPGEKRLAVRQPLHSHDYGAFEGEIPEGYGKGNVELADSGKVLITKAEPNKIHFTVAHKRYPERYVLFKPEKNFGGKDTNWLMMNTTPVDPLKYDKIKYKSVPMEKVAPILDNLQSGSSVQAKIDGALTMTRLLKDKIDVLSHRTSKVTGRPIAHTERVFGTIPNVDIPKQYRNSVLSGELYGMQDNKAIQPQHLGGLLNSSLEKSLTNQADQHIKLKNTIFDIRQLGNKPITNQIPYNERMQHIHNILNSITGADADLVKNVYSPAEEATTPEAAKALTEQITSGQHPLTNEGIIIHPNKGNPLKAKLTDEHDVHIRGVIPGKGKYTDKGIGAFIYSHEPEGPIAGEVGSGLSDAVRADMFSNPEEYVGRKARVRATKVLPSGALFQPSLISLHEG